MRPAIQPAIQKSEIKAIRVCLYFLYDSDITRKYLYTNFYPKIFTDCIRYQFFKPLRLPVPQLAETATAISDTLSKSQNRYLLLHHSAIGTFIMRRY